MSELGFKQNCSFCQSRIGSDYCLLPFQFVELYVAPNDVVSAVMDITEIHMQYGLETLNWNLSFINGLKSSRTQSITTDYVENPASKGPQWSDIVNESVDSFSNIPSQLDADAKSSSHQTSYSTYLTRQMPEDIVFNGFSSPVSKSSDETNPEVPSGVKIPHSQDKIIKSILEEKTKSQPTKGKAKMITKSPTKVELDRDSINHLIQDLLLSVKASYNLHSKQRGNMRSIQLKSAIMSESELRANFSSKYKPSYDTTLDGFKAIAKEIIARHSHEQVHAWECGASHASDPLCILAYPSLNAIDESNEQEQLTNCLADYFSAALNSPELLPIQRDTVLKSVRFELSKLEMDQAFQWINNRARLEKTKMVMHTNKITTQNSLSTTKKSNLFPPADENLLRFIDLRLQVIVNQEVINAGDNTPRLNDQTNLQKYFYKLACDFIRRNKGWKNENSFTTPNHLTKVEESTGTKAAPSESYLVFQILKSIIDKFRIDYKQRYPSTAKSIASQD